MIKKRIDRIARTLRQNHRDHLSSPRTPNRPQPLRAIPKDRAEERAGTHKGRVNSWLSMAAEIINCWLVTQQKPLEQLVPNWLIRRLLLWVYQRYGFAAFSFDGKTYFNLEHRGVFSDEATARWWANCDGGGIKEIPFNVPLPEETAQYGKHDFPQSEFSPDYRNRRLPFTVVPTYNLERLEEMRRRTDALVEEYRQSA